MERLGDKPYKKIDWLLLGAVLCLCIFGLVTLASVTCDPYAENGLSGLAGIASRMNSRIVLMQILWICTGLLLCAVCMVFDYSVFKTFSLYIYLAGILLLVALLVMQRLSVGSGRASNAIYFTDNISIQPGELAKLAYIVFMARALSDREEPVRTVRQLLPFLVITAIPVGLIILGKEVGTALTFLCIFAGMMFLAGTDWKLLAGLALAGCAAMVPLWFLLNGFQRDRILDFLDPSRDVLGSGYQVDRAKTAAGSGQLFGKGLFSEGLLGQLDYVPDEHTDFIFSVTAEAVGFVGASLLVLGLAFVLWRIMRNARRARDRFGEMLCCGVAAMMFFHITENLCMNVGLLPVTGIPLPFISYGGSAMWANLIGIGLVLSVHMRRRTGALANYR